MRNKIIINTHPKIDCTTNGIINLIGAISVLRRYTRHTDDDDGDYMNGGHKSVTLHNYLMPIALEFTIFFFFAGEKIQVFVARQF